MRPVLLCGGRAGWLRDRAFKREVKNPPLLCGILVMTALLSINLVLVMKGTGGLSLVSFFTSPTIFSSAPATLLPETIGGYTLRPIFVALVIAVVCKYALDWFLSTKSGLLLRAAGNNEQYVTMLARSPGSSKILASPLVTALPPWQARSSHSRRAPLICRWALAWW